MKPIAGLQNPSDIATKVLSSERIKYLLGLAGMYNSDGLIKSSKPPQTAKVQRIASKVDIENLVRSVVYAAIALSQQQHVDAALMDAESVALNEEVTWDELIVTIWNNSNPGKTQCPPHLEKQMEGVQKGWRATIALLRKL